MDRLQESRAIANSVHNWAECHRVNRKLVDALRVLISATTFELGEFSRTFLSSTM